MTEEQEDVIRTMAWVTFASQILHSTLSVSLASVGLAILSQEYAQKRVDEMLDSAAQGADAMVRHFDNRFRSREE